MFVCKTTHHVLGFPQGLEDSLSQAGSLESVVDLYFDKLKKDIKKCPSAYFYALINLDRFNSKSPEELRKCRDLFVAKINELPIHTELPPQESPVRRMPLLQQYSIGLSGDKLCQLTKKLTEVLEDKDFRKKLLIDFIQEITEEKDLAKDLLKELIQLLLKDEKFMASNYKDIERMELIMHNELLVETILDNEDFMKGLVEDFRKNPAIVEKRKKILERLSSELSLYYEKKDSIKEIFTNFIKVIPEKKEFLEAFDETKEQLEKALENQELFDSLLKDEKFLANILSIEEFCKSSSMSKEGIDILNKILFKLSLNHEKIDDSFITNLIRNCPDKKAKFFLGAIIKECVPAFSSRIGFTNTNVDQGMQTIQSLVKHVGLSLQEKIPKEDLRRVCKLIYNIISKYEHRALFKKQLDTFLSSFIKEELLTNSENLDIALRRRLTSSSLQECTLTDKISLFIRITELPNFEKSTLTSFSHLPVLNSSIRVLSLLLPADKFFLENPGDLRLTKAFAKQRTNQFLFPLPRQNSSPLIDINSYLKHRFPNELLRILIKNHQAIEVFLGDKQQFDNYIEQNFSEYQPVSEFKAPSSFKFFIFAHEKDLGRIKIFIQNVTSPSRLTHLGYVLSLAGLMSDNLLVSGSFEDAYAKEQASLEEWSKCWDPQKPPKVLFVGTMISPYLDKTISIKTDKPTPSDATLCKGSYLVFETPEKTQIPVLSFSMPNGELAGILTEFCLKKGVETVVMLGAGGALKSKSFHPSISDYITFESSRLGETDLTIPKTNLHPILDQLGEEIPFCQFTQKHRTASSPLEEDESWLENSLSHNISMVDVETGHIFKSFISHLATNPNIRILPGLFVSDIVNNPEETLSKKISPKTAFSKTPELIKKIIKSI